MLLRRGTKARLILNGIDVGGVTVRKQDGSWTFGDFEPTGDFSRFAPLFGRWSLVLHADGDDAPISRAAADELREAELEIDRLRAHVMPEDGDLILEVGSLNIDGGLIDWKER